MLAQALRDLVMREAELFDEAPQPARLLDGVEVGALQVLDQAEDQLLVVAGVAAHDGGHGPQPGQTRGAPPALAGDQLISVAQGSHQQGLQHAVHADGFRQLAKRLGVETRPHLLARGLDLVDGDHLRHKCFAFRRHRDQRVESSAESARAWLAHLSSSSFARAR